jgi:hypothetical protein
LRIEWAKTRSFGLRNTEEVDLEEEEMRRTPEYLQWRANWWESKKIHTEAHRPDLLEDPRQREGHDAYATHQARMLRSIATRFERKWDGVAGLIAEGRAKVEAAEAEAASVVQAHTQRASGSDDSEGEDGDGDDDEDGDGDDEDE